MLDETTAIDDFEIWLIGKGRSPQTMRTYGNYTRVASRLLHERKLSLFRVTARDLALLLADLPGYSRNTRRNIVCSLRGFYVFAHETGLRADDPTKGMSTAKPKQQPRQPFDVWELRRLLEAVKAPVDRALLLTLINTGARIGEVTTLRIVNVNWGEQTLLLQGKGSKERWVGVDEATLDALREHIGGRTSGYVFVTFDGQPMTRERARKRLVDPAVRAGVSHLFPHRFRITFANLFMQHDGDLSALQQLMGHADIKETVHYAAFHSAQRALDKHRRFMGELGISAEGVAP